MAYDMKTVKAPRLEGSKLLFAAWLLEKGLTGRRLAPLFLKNLGVDHFRQLHPDTTPLFSAVGPPAPVDQRAPTGTEPPRMGILEQISTTARPDASFAFPSVADYARSYRDGSLTPTDVGERIVHVLEHQDRGDPPLYAFISWRAEEIMRQAADSTERIRAGNPRSILEGVPIAVKDEIDVTGHATGLGTSFLSQTIAEDDAFMVAKLRAAGAIIVGKTNMHEIGIGVTGLNPFHGTPVNPYAPWRYPGGSSSGSASAVAAGICPVALGADGGGSVRIPAAYCGVFGLKLTMGRVSSRGEYPLASTVANAGPIAGNVRDLALSYLVMSGPDPKDPATLEQPAPTIDGLLETVAGLRIGVYQPWFEHAQPDVAAATRSLLDALVEQGAELVEVELEGLDQLRIAHLITISSEMRASMERFYPDHCTDFGNETRANLAIARYLSPTDYVHAQQIRRKVRASFDAAFAAADVLATPTTANLPPRLHRDRLLSGVSDLESLSQTMRFAIPANMLGYPAISVPAGFVTAHSRRFWHTVDERDEDGNVYSQVPVGMQFMGRHWEEATLLRVARVCEEMVVRPRPRVYLSPFESHNPIESGHEQPVNT